MMPVEGMGQMAEMYKDGKTYEVMVDDKRNPGSPIFAFGLNGKIGEYQLTQRYVCSEKKSDICTIVSMRSLSQNK